GQAAGDRLVVLEDRPRDRVIRSRQRHGDVAGQVGRARREQRARSARQQAGGRAAAQEAAPGGLAARGICSGDPALSWVHATSGRVRGGALTEHSVNARCYRLELLPWGILRKTFRITDQITYQELGAERGGEPGKVVGEPGDVRLVVLHRDQPLLDLSPGRQEDPAIVLVEPVRVAVGIVDAEEAAEVADRFGGEHHAALGADRYHLSVQAVPVDLRLQAGDRLLPQRLD